MLLLPGAVCAQTPVRGTAAIEQSLHKLNTVGGVLMIGAHPDDENTAVLAYFARGRHLRTAYLSCTRGEGGQNLIGPEQGDLLGLIRTHELLGARAIDGAEQFFTRAIDFGYTKTAQEALDKWGRERVLSDMVWVIRRFRPDVIILRFSGTPRDGHGQHQASAILGKEAYTAAADPQRFADQLRYVQPWQARRLVYNVIAFSPQQIKAAAALPNKVAIDAGEYNPVLGESYAEIAGQSRSMHRSQGMGAPQRRGSQLNYFTTVAGEPARQDILDGIDTSWERLAGGAKAGRLLEKALREFEPAHPEKIVPVLLEARPLVAALRDPAAAEKLRELDETAAECAGLWLDAAADRYAVVPGGKLQVRVTALNRSPLAVTLASASLDGDRVAQERKLETNQPAEIRVDREIAADHPYSQPYWLVQPPQGDTYTVEDQRLIGQADQPPLLTATFTLDLGGGRIEILRPVRYRYIDRVHGERTRPVVVVPPVAVSPAERVVMFPAAGSRRIQVAVEANTPKAAGDLRLEVPAGWRAEPSSGHFAIAEAGEQQAMAFTVTPPAADSTGELRAVATVAGREISSGMQVIEYPHIPPQTVFPPATAKLVRADVRVTAHKIGYVMGAGDLMPDALRQLGCEVVLLSPTDLEEGNLAGFDAIVTGVRAYNTRPDLKANEPRLLDYVRHGGTLVVQYNNLDTPLNGIGPWPITITHARVSVEDVPVAFPHPDNPLLKGPNAISEQDFQGWIQERGLYFAEKWDPRYETVLESHDPGEKPLPGGMLYARYGKGVYIFSAYSWFRELPAGVSGAYRVFANMISAK